MDIAQHSNAFIGCLAWIPLGVWIMAFVNWMIMGEIDVPTGFAGIFVAIGLGYEAFNPPVPEMAPLTVIAVLITVVMFPFVRSGMSRRALKQIDIETLERAYTALGGRPDNVMAKIQIAKILFQLGVCGHAMRIVEALVPHMPASFFAEDLHMLKKWHMMRLEARYFLPITCSECQFSNTAGSIYCRNCGAPFLLNYVKGTVVGSRLGKKLLGTWIAMIAMLVGIPLARALPTGAGVTVIVLIMALAIFMVAVAFRDTTGGVAS